MSGCHDPDFRCAPAVHNHARCARCAGPACRRCNRCGGCGRLVCPGCETDVGQAPFAWPGDVMPHPHVDPA